MSDIQFLSIFLRPNENNIMKNLDEIKSEDLRPRYMFNNAGLPQFGIAPLEFVNIATAIYYSGSGYDLGEAPHFSSNPVPTPSFETDAVWTMFSSAYVGIHTNDETMSISQHASTIYGNWVSNYLYWRTKTGEPLIKDGSDAPFDYPIVRFINLPTYDLIKFHFVARLAALLDVTLLSYITKDQMKAYAELCLCAAELDVINLQKLNLS